MTEEIKKHRVQVDIDLLADSHEEAVEKVQTWVSQVSSKYLPGLYDITVIEEGEDYCPTENPKAGNFTPGV